MHASDQFLIILEADTAGALLWVFGFYNWASVSIKGSFGATAISSLKFNQIWSFIMDVVSSIQN